MAVEAVAIINTSPDTVDLLRQVLQRAGFLVVSCYTFDIRDGRLDGLLFRGLAERAWSRGHAGAVAAIVDEGMQRTTDQCP